MGRQVILLDRDGVLNRGSNEYVLRPEQLVLIEGAAAAVGCLVRAGYTILVVTNQSCLGKGLLSFQELERIHHRLQASLGEEGGGIHQIYVCPHRAEAQCSCRKPRPGLLHRASREWFFSLSDCWFVGDNWTDVEAAVAAGCRPILVRSGVQGKRAKPDPSVPDFSDLADFVKNLLGGHP